MIHSPNSFITIIIPCYNYGKYIAETLDSVLAQTYQHWEAIVIDDGSTDNTATVVAKYVVLDPRISYHYQQNSGLSSARNAGLGLAQGQYIQLLDADDLIVDTKLALQSKLLDEYIDIDLVYSDTYLFKDTGNANESRTFEQFKLQMAPISGKGQKLAMHVAYDNVFLPGSPLFRKRMVEVVGLFNEELFSLEDWNFWYRAILLNMKFVYDNQPGTEFYARTHGNNMSGNRYRMWKNKIQARRNLIEIIRTSIASNEAGELDLPIVLKRNLNLLYEEEARFNIFFANVSLGLVNTMRYFITGENRFSIWYDSAYWLKERLLGHNKID